MATRSDKRYGGIVTDAALLDRIAATADTCFGKPRIRGTRMRVVDVLELLAHGAPVSEIVEDYPWVTAEDVQACLLYAAERMNHPVADIAAE